MPLGTSGVYTGRPTTPQSNKTDLGIPNLDALTNSASSNIQDLLSGLPSASYARTRNAWNGAAQGQPATGGAGTFQDQRGVDFYRTESNQNRQTGLQDLLAMIGQYSGNVSPSAGQLLQDKQFGQAQGQQASQFSQNNANEELRILLQALGMVNQ